MNILIQKLLIFTCVLLAITIFAEVANACSCAGVRTVDEEFKDSLNVVIIKLQSFKDVSEKEAYSNEQAKFFVQKVLKGELRTGEVLIFEQGQGADCVWGFDKSEIGEEYLFYLDKEDKEKNGAWSGSVCSRSGLVKHRRNDLLYLAKIHKVKGKTRLSGILNFDTESFFDEDESQLPPLSNRKIKIIGEGKTFEVFTDKNGVYEIYDIPLGKYKVYTENINGWQTSGLEGVEIEIKEKNQVERSFNYWIDNSIRGKVFDINGNPAKVCLDLVPSKQAEKFNKSDCTNGEGKYFFNALPEGGYIIVVNSLLNNPWNKMPISPIYYPNSITRENAIEVFINAGEHIEEINIISPIEFKFLKEKLFPSPKSP